MPTQQPSSPRAGHIWLAIVLIAATLLTSPLAVAREGTPAGATGPATEMPTETPTETPTHIATETPTQVSTEIPGTGVPTETATSVATETPPPTSPPVLPNTDALTATDAVSPATLAPGETWQGVFAYAVTTPRAATAIRAELRLADGSPASGWAITARAGGVEASGGGVVELAETGATEPGTSFPLAIVVTAPAEIAAEQTVSLWIGSTATTGTGEVETGVEATSPLASLTTVPPPEAPSAPAARGISPQSVTAGGICTQTSPSDVVAHPDSVTFRCASDTNVLQQLLTLDRGGLYTSYRIDISSPTSGWEYRLGGSGSWRTSSTNAGYGLVVNLLANPLDFQVELRPANSNPSSQVGRATITLKGCTLDLGLACVSLPLILDWTTVNTTTIEARVPGPQTLCNPTATAENLDFDPSVWNGVAYPPVTGNLAITITAAGQSCAGLPAGWSVRVQPSALTGPGGTIPATNMGVTEFIDDHAAPYLTVIPRTALDSSQKVPIATTRLSSTFPVDGVIWNAQFSLDPPDHLPTGDYTGTIEVDAYTGL